MERNISIERNFNFRNTVINNIITEGAGLNREKNSTSANIPKERVKQCLMFVHSH